MTNQQATINADAGTVTINLDYAKQRHDQAMAEVQFWRKVLGLEPIQTRGMQRRKFREIPGNSGKFREGIRG